MCGSYVFVRVRVCKYMVVLINMVCHCHYSSLTVLCSSDCFAVVTAQVVSTFDEITQSYYCLHSCLQTKSENWHSKVSQNSSLSKQIS